MTAKQLNQIQGNHICLDWNVTALSSKKLFLYVSEMHTRAKIGDTHERTNILGDPLPLGDSSPTRSHCHRF